MGAIGILETRGRDWAASLKSRAVARWRTFLASETLERAVKESADPNEWRYQNLMREIEEEFPRFQLIRKSDSEFQNIIHKAVKVATFGQMTTYKTDYHTTIGYRVYVTDDWASMPAARRYVTMRHERVHLRQFRRYTVVGMGLLYVLFPLPSGLAYFRAKFEREAYAESIRASAEVYGIDYVQTQSYRDHVISQFTGASYGWMWPFRYRMERWYDSILNELGDA